MMLAIIGAVGVGMALLLGGCTIAAVMGAGRVDRQAQAIQEERQACPEGLVRQLQTGEGPACLLPRVAC